MDDPVNLTVTERRINISLIPLKIANISVCSIIYHIYRTCRQIAVLNEVVCRVSRGRSVSSRSRRLWRWSGWWYDDRRPPVSSSFDACSRGTSPIGPRRAQFFWIAGCWTSLPAVGRSRPSSSRARGPISTRRRLLLPRPMFTHTRSVTGRYPLPANSQRSASRPLAHLLRHIS